MQLSNRIFRMLPENIQTKVKTNYYRILNQEPKWQEHNTQDNVYDSANKLELYYKDRGPNDLENYFLHGSHTQINKHLKYFEVYDNHFSPYRGKDIVFVEIGVQRGGSLQMWKNYFGEGAKIIGIDIDPQCKKYEEDNIRIYIGSQDDKNFWKDFIIKEPNIDILLDDGGHMMRQQRVTFDKVFGHIAKGGCYVCEDLHTSYWREAGGGYKHRNSFIEYLKSLIDCMNAYSSKSVRLRPNEWTHSIKSIHFYESMVVIEKEKEYFYNYPVSID